ncbi:MAG: hypothetical protein KY445_17180, partial [Armatimonadetes bacterium]|nr:hypothetical protein [Armatimonadota bacterium]
VGVDGDYYLNSTNGDVYTRAAGIYGLRANIKGPAGADGSGGTTDTTNLAKLDTANTFSLQQLVRKSGRDGHFMAESTGTTGDDIATYGLRNALHKASLFLANSAHPFGASSGFFTESPEGFIVSDGFARQFQVWTTGTQQGQVRAGRSYSLQAADGKTYRPVMNHDSVNRIFDIDYNGVQSGNQDENGYFLRLGQGKVSIYTKQTGQAVREKFSVNCGGGVSFNTYSVMRNINNEGGDELLFQGFDSTAANQMFRIQKYSMAVGKVLLGVSTPESALHVYSKAPESPVAICQAAAAQTANLQEWRNSSGTALSRVGPNGTFTGPISTPRGTVSASTASIANGAVANFEIAAGKLSNLLNAANNVAAEIRLYTTAAARTADAGRAATTAPTAGSGLLYQGTTTATALSIPCTPSALLFNLDATPSATIYGSAKNLSGATNAITTTLTTLILER